MIAVFHDLGFLDSFFLNIHQDVVMQVIHIIILVLKSKNFPWVMHLHGQKGLKNKNYQDQTTW